jgi:adenylyltransferase/sulfurtransferase
MQQITATELKAKMDAGEDVQLIDVRQPDEHAFARIEGATLIPMSEIMSRMNELDQTRDTVVYCRSGVRSARVIETLQQSGYAGKLNNLAGGILAWSDEVDPSIPKY